jgi:hypothetical protein
MGVSQYIPALQFQMGQPTQEVPKELLKRRVEFRLLGVRDFAAFFVPIGADLTTKVPYYSTRTGYQADGMPLGTIYAVTEAANTLEAEYTLRSLYAFKVLKGRVPQKEDIYDPFLADLVLVHNGVRIYRTWQNRRGKVYSHWGYAVEGDHDADDWEDDSKVFSLDEDVDLEGYQGEKPIPLENQLRYAIDTGQITRHGRPRR